MKTCFSFWISGQRYESIDQTVHTGQWVSGFQKSSSTLFHSHYYITLTKGDNHHLISSNKSQDALPSYLSNPAREGEEITRHCRTQLYIHSIAMWTIQEYFVQKSLQEKSLAEIFEKNHGKRSRYQRSSREIISTEIDSRDIQEK